MTDGRFSCLGAGWFPDSKHILFCATEAGRRVRTYILDMDRGSIGPVTPDGVAGGLVSPDDGRFAYFRRDFQPEDPDAISVFRIDLTTGHRELWAHLFPQEFARAANLLPVAIAPDRRALAYTYIRDTHDLYLVEWT